MANQYIGQSRAEQTRVYPTFAGVDFSSDPADVEPHRFAYLKNMWRDYGSEQGGAVETFPGYREVYRGKISVGGDNLNGKLGRVRGLHPFRDEKGETLIAVDYADRMRVYDPREEYSVREHVYDGMPGEAEYYDPDTWQIDDSDVTPSRSVGWHGGIALVDGKRYRIIKDGERDINGEYEPYVPTTYADGKAYEQRNMLTDKFLHKYNLSNLDSYKTEYNSTPSAEGTIFDFEYDMQNKTATVTGFIDGEFREIVNIPEKVTFGGVTFEITKIAEKAFRSANVKKVYVPKTINSVGWLAFEGCAELSEVVFCVEQGDAGFESSLDRIEYDAFKNCPKLNFIFLPPKSKAGELKIEDGAFYGCGADFVVLPEHFLIYAPDVNLESEDFSEYCPFYGAGRIYLQSGSFDESDPYNNAFIECFDGNVRTYETEATFANYDEETGETKDPEIIELGDGLSFPDYAGEIKLNEESAELTGPAILIKLEGEATYKLIARYKNRNNDLTKTDSEVDEENLYGFTIYEMAKSIDEVRVGNKTADELSLRLYYEMNGEYVSRVLIGCDYPDMIRGGDLFIEGTAESSKFNTVEGHENALSGNAFYKGTAKEAIDGCTLCEAFDGRIFISGNPRLPNTVFYTHRDLTGANNPTYFGVLNFFNDGVGNEPITSLLASSSSLCVLKGDTTNEGSVYYHTGADTGEDLLPRIYPSTQGAAGIGCLGPSCNFLDDPVFISRRGLESIGKEQTNLERSFEHRSYNVDSKLLQEDLRHAMLAEWQGYLVIAFADRMYLADSRQLFAHKNGVANYEWYYVEGINGFSMAYEHDVHSFGGKTFLEDIWKLQAWEFYFEGYPYWELTVEADDGYRYDVVPEFWEHTDVENPSTIREYRCYAGDKFLGYVAGVLIPINPHEKEFCPCYRLDDKKALRTFKITAVCAVDDNLYFGTEGGCVYRFNTDRRQAGGRIPEENYSFDGTRYESAFALKADNCDIPGYTKKTSRGSFVLRTKPFRHSRIKARGRADRGELSVWREIAASTSSELDFSSTAFDALSFGGGDAKICIVRENFRRWYEKQLYFYTDGYCEPFGIYSASFRYTVQGKLKI